MSSLERTHTPGYPDLAVLGGISRAGKDTTMQAYTEATQLMFGETVTVSTDDIRGQLRDNPELRQRAYSDPDSAERALFQQKIDNELYVGDKVWIPNILHRVETDGSSYFHNRHDNQNRAVWKLADIPQRITNILATPGIGRLLLQGVAMLPEHAAELRDTYPKMRALFLINTNPDHVGTILNTVHEAQATNPSSNWMSNWSDKRIEGYVNKNIELSERRRTEAEKYGFPWKDMGYGDFRYNVFRNVGYLANGDPLEA